MLSALWFLLLAFVVIAFPARAAPSIEVKPVQGSAPLELRLQGSSYSGKLTVANRSDRVQRLDVALRSGSESDPRLPPGTTARLAGNTTNAALKPGESRELEVSIPVPRVGPRLNEVWGHVLVQPEGESEASVAGFHLAPPDGPSRWLSLALLIPLLGAVVFALLRARNQSRARLRNTVIATGVAELALLGFVASRFDASLTRFSGTEGIQLVERVLVVRSLGIEYFVAVDGVSLGLMLLVPLLVIGAALVAPDKSFELGRAWTLVLVLASGAIGLLASFDLALMLAFWTLVAVVTTLLVASVSSDGPKSARALGIQLGLATVLFAFAFWQLSSRATPAYLPDGAALSRSFSLIELAHGGFSPRSTALLGTHPVKVVFASLFVGSWLVLGAPPFHGSLIGALARIPASLALVVVGIVPALGAFILLRVGYIALPDGTAWAAQTLATIGVAGALIASLAAVGATDMHRFVGYLSAVQSGLCLLALGSTTAIGVQAALTLCVSRALSSAMLLSVSSVVRSRVGTQDAARLGGLASELPAFGALAAVAFWGAAAGPGTSSFVGLLQTVAGALPTTRVSAVISVLVFALVAAASLRVFSRAFLGNFPEALRKSPVLEPHAGRFPLLEEREATALIALAVLLVGLGLWTRPFLRITDSTCLDYAEYVNKPGVLEVS